MTWSYLVRHSHLPVATTPKQNYFFSVGGSQLAIVPEPGVGHIEFHPTPCWKFYWSNGFGMVNKAYVFMSKTAISATESSSKEF